MNLPNIKWRWCIVCASNARAVTFMPNHTSRWFDVYINPKIRNPEKAFNTFSKLFKSIVFYTGKITHKHIHTHAAFRTPTEPKPVWAKTHKRVSINRTILHMPFARDKPRQLLCVISIYTMLDLGLSLCTYVSVLLPCEMPWMENESNWTEPNKCGCTKQKTRSIH